ncbi:iron-containing alcohol dehydrogenase [Desulfocurvus sp. DL9XJH121]
MKFSYHNTTKILFGQGQTAALSKAIPTDKKVLVIYGGGSIKKNGVYDQVAAALSGHQWAEFSGVEPNPSVETLQGAIDMVRDQGVEFLVGVGGGSVSDGTKFVAAASQYDGAPWDIPTGKHRPKAALPLGVVMTLPATGSESNFRGVVTRKASKEKLAFYTPLVQPRFAVLDPDVIKSLPERQVANGICDAFVHVCEQYLTYPVGAMVQDGYAEGLLRALWTLAETYADRDDDTWRANLMYAANQGLNDLIALGVPQDWTTHRMGHEVTALFGVDHARTLTAIQPALLRELVDEKREKLEQMGQRVLGLAPGEDLAERAIDAVEGMYKRLGMPVRLSEAGVDAQSVDRMVELLDKHRMLPLGERKTVDAARCKAIFTAAL